MFLFESIIRIEKGSKVAIYRQIAISISSAIGGGVLKAATQLPGSRHLANALKVHRKTVIAAYAELEAQGWIKIIPQKGALVSDQIPVLNPRKWNQNNSQSSYEHDLQLDFRIIDETERGQGRDRIPDVVIDDGLPDVRLSPIDELLKNYRSQTSRKPSIRSANIGTTQGTLRLREELVSYLSVTRGLNISPDNLLITHGAQMCIYLSARLTLNGSSSIVVGKPNYHLANKAFLEAGAKITEVNVDDQGVDVDAIERICRRQNVTAVYVIPHHHYPTTATLSVDRRMKLLELSKQFSFIIIEDDYDYDYHYSSSPYLPLASAGHEGNLVYIGSFSKILDPSLRIGFMVAPKNFIVQCVALRKTVDVGGDGYMQNALATLLKEGELKRHLKKAKKIYHQRRDFLDTLLRKELADYLSYTVPSGGMAIWVTLRPDLDVRRLAENQWLEIIRIDERQNAFRFGFASMDEIELEHTVGFLKLVLLKMLPLSAQQ